MCWTLVPCIVAHAPPSFRPCGNLTCCAKDVPPSGSDEHAALANVAKRTTFRARKEKMIIMQIIINENISQVGGLWYVCTQCGDWTS
jgi:hypothetical protein